MKQAFEYFSHHMGVLLSMGLYAEAPSLSTPSFSEVCSSGTELTVCLEKSGVVCRSVFMGFGRHNGEQVLLIDALSPMQGNRYMQEGAELDGEFLYRGIVHSFHSSVIGRIRGDFTSYLLSVPLSVQVREQAEFF